MYRCRLKWFSENIRNPEITISNTTKLTKVQKNIHLNPDLCNNEITCHVSDRLNINSCEKILEIRTNFDSACFPKSLGRAERNFFKAEQKEIT